MFIVILPKSIGCFSDVTPRHLIVCCDWSAKQSSWSLFSVCLRFKIVRIYNYGRMIVG